MTLVLHISNLVNSSFTIGGQNSTTLDTSSSQTLEFLLRALEINRALIAAANKDWESEEALYQTIKGLIDQQKELEYQVANTLNP
ncbi:hypothetical protein [Algoriphagus sp.]|uniref:hypothetical protein n=1 Tax=Algoriphagus sp. TaxID=1872435 RepID=UPI003F6F9232